MDIPIVVISPETNKANELETLIKMFELGLRQFHVRKPSFTYLDIEQYIQQIPQEYHQYLVLHSHYHLVKKFKLKGIQVGKNRINDAKEYLSESKYLGYSAHSFSDILENKSTYTHFFISPVHNSISKQDYKTAFSKEEIETFLVMNKELKVIALGGIDNNNILKTFNYGFSGVAVLGSVWQTDNGVEAFAKLRKAINKREFSLSIAGFDPSSGAGITADIKTFEQNTVQGLGVNTAITYQNENEFNGVDWIGLDQILKQIDVLFKKYNPAYVKIGLIESFAVLNKVIKHLKKCSVNVKIIWDPIIKASVGFEFHTNINQKELFQMLKDIYLVTPNLEECQALFKTTNLSKLNKIIVDNKLNNILLKGGHSQFRKGTDVLLSCDSQKEFIGKELEESTKHGTGCVLSAAICSALARGLSLDNAIVKAKDYVNGFIDSNKGILGYHKIY